MSEPASASREALELGLSLESQQRHVEAYAAFERATQLDARNGRAWRHRGNQLRRAGELGAAATCFERAIENGDDRALNTFFLSAIGVGPVVLTPPPSFVRALFDQYAVRFDEHLLDALHYSAPQRLSALVCGIQDAMFDDALDLGCGTGLMGQAIRSHVHRLTGVDASAQMLARADQCGAYAKLIAGDMVEYVQATSDRHDLVLACDVFNYLGDLAPVFSSVFRVLRPGGVFAFTAEACEAEAGVDLLPTLRYAHSQRHLRELAQAHGLEVRSIDREPLREQDSAPVEGLVVALVRPG